MEQDSLKTCAPPSVEKGGRKPINKGKVAKNVFIICMLLYPIIQFLVFWLYVNIDTFVLTFEKFSYAEGSVGYQFNGLKNYLHIFDIIGDKYQALQPSVINSFLYFVFNNFILLPLSIWSAYILSRKIFGYKVFRVIFFFPSIISIVVLTMVYKFMLDTSFGGPVNKIFDILHLGGIVPANGWLGSKDTAQFSIFVYCLWAGIGYNVVLLSGAITRIPSEIIESAHLDGCGVWRELVSMTFPLIMPTVTTLFVMGCTVMFTLFLQPMLLTSGGPDNVTMTIAYYVVNNVKGSPSQQIEAATVGVFFSALGIPIIFGFKSLLEKISPQVEF